MAPLAKAVAPAIKVRGLRADCFVMHHGDAAQALRITRKKSAPLQRRGADRQPWRQRGHLERLGRRHMHSIFGPAQLGIGVDR